MVLLAQHVPHAHLLPRWLIHFGVFGVFIVATLDASVIPLPIPGTSDLLVLLLCTHHAHPALVTLAAVAGALAGGYFTWAAGKAGGEPMLRRYASDRLIQHIKPWVERNGTLTVVMASLMPPPLPLMPFLLAAGALGVSRARYLTALGLARTVRYGLVAFLAATYGHTIIHLWEKYLAGWSSIILWTFLGLLIAAIGFGIWKYRHNQRKESGRPAVEQA